MFTEEDLPSLWDILEHAMQARERRTPGNREANETYEAIIGIAAQRIMELCMNG